MENKKENSRRDFIKKSAMLTITGAALHVVSNATAAGSVFETFETDDKFTLPALPYAFDALEPHIDRMTMEIHHGKHHQAYIDKLNKAFEEQKIKLSLDKLLMNVSGYDAVVRNNAGGHWNHSFFWKLMKPAGGGAPTGKVAEAINNSFGSFAEMKTKFNDAAKNRFGSGWAWVVVNKGKLEIGSTPNQDNPLMDLSQFRGKPVIGIDVWEHAYYLKYQNKRADYIDAWWNVVNWDEVAKSI